MPGDKCLVTSRWHRKLKFCIMIWFTTKPLEKLGKPDISDRTIGESMKLRKTAVNPKTQNVCRGAKPDAPDASRNLQLVKNVRVLPWKLKFCIVVWIIVK